jgi:pyruvate formate lyase activating enzyme
VFKSIIWNSSIDYQDNLATVLFTGGCNFSCEYCHNKDLVHLPDIDFDKEILPKLINRKSFINHVLITGGEPLIHKELKSYIIKLKQNGFFVGINTNGAEHKFLNELIPLIDYVGLDIKTSLDKYNNFTDEKSDYIYSIVKNILSSGIDYDFRTTLYPQLVSKEDCVKIASMLFKLYYVTF